jgi:alkylation response protein AidB-like acyl-CoA dehydrogenase
MAMALSDEHRALAASVRAVVTAHGAGTVARAALDAPGGALPASWRALAAQEWLGLHVPECLGGSGAGLPELVVVAEELGRCLAPGPFVAGAVAAAVLAEAVPARTQPAGTPDAVDQGAGDTQRDVLVRNTLAALLAGSLVAGLAVGDAGRPGRAVVIAGRWADVLLLPDGPDVLLLDVRDPAVRVTDGAGLDPSLGAAVVEVAPGAAAVRLPGTAATALHLLRVVCAATSAGGARACLDTAVQHARTRRQFGRAIGSFQAVKHRLADMLAAVELATAAVWAAAADTAQPELGADAAVLLAPAAYLANARAAVQVLGATGFSWEHDAHLHLRRATALHALVDVPAAGDDLYARFAAGARYAYGLDLPGAASGHRGEVRAFVDRYRAEPEEGRRRLLVEAGYLVPHWPAPHGRGAGPVEQLVVEEELAGLEVPTLGVSGWVLLTVLQTGDAGQVGRWVQPTLRGELAWYQLFSEPEAGSDAAAIRTRADRTEGGWLVTGEKTWITMAHRSDLGLATVRTAPAAAGRAGITAMVVDLHTPGVTVRPITDICGGRRFAAVLLDRVFVPDADVVGAVGAGWSVVRAALGNERVTIGAGWGQTLTATDLVGLAEGRGPDAEHRRRVARLLAEAHGLRAVNLRRAVRAVAGQPPGPEANVTKVLAAEHAQRVTELAAEIAWPGLLVGEQPQLARDYLFARSLTIGGGTSEISRNLTAERILGLPRDPLQG